MRSNTQAALWLALVLSVGVGAAFAQTRDEAFLKRDIAYFQERSAVSVHARLLGAEPLGDHGAGEGLGGYPLFRVRARALETFKGAPLGEFAFDVALESPGRPPEGGDYILNLSRTPEGRLYPTDESVGWIRATPGLLAHARRLPRR
ncbi:hypothetical protein J5226_12365 [Lysobacter sp. K5869]|uniref:hypothetical protein n=1 Tax=Lysobacter sp. K5869 TaxID=2820808 RepID=UPI001C06290A|nr:hypothetical protein [Lysobacter sp. K5869]QWP79125.1 hypothetical protein J5226_12365 [Lysobacter sp. K5869]